MKKNSLIPATRISTELKAQVGKALDKYNSLCLGEMSLSDFVRMSLKRLSQDILTAEKITLRLE